MSRGLFLVFPKQGINERGEQPSHVSLRKTTHEFPEHQHILDIHLEQNLEEKSLIMFLAFEVRHILENGEQMRGSQQFNWQLVVFHQIVQLRTLGHFEDSLL